MLIQRHQVLRNGVQFNIMDLCTLSGFVVLCGFKMIFSLNSKNCTFPERLTVLRGSIAQSWP